MEEGRRQHAHKIKGPKRMKAGTLDRKVTIQSYTTTQDSFGQEVKTWIDAYTNIPARIAPKKGDEDVEGKQVVSTTQIELQTRFMAVDPSATMRIFYNAKYYNVLSVEEINRREGWVWRCELRDNIDGTILL